MTAERSSGTLRNAQVELLIVVLRTSRPWLLSASGALLVLYAWLEALRNASPDGTLRWVSLAIACVVAFGVEDAAAPLVAASVRPLRFRRALRVAHLTCWGLLTWVAARLVVGHAARGLGAHLAWLAMLTTVSIGVSLAAARREESSAGIVGSLSALVLVAGGLIAPHHWPVADVLESASVGRDLLRVGLVMAIVITIALRDPANRSARGAVRVHRPISRR